MLWQKIEERLKHKSRVYLTKKTVLETKRNKLEDAVIDGTIDREAYQRKHTEINDKISNLNNLIQEIENNANLNINLIEEVLAFTRNIHTTYLHAPQFLKRHYLRFFFEKLVVKDRMIVKIVYTPIFSVLQENHAVILTKTQLPEPWTNISIDFEAIIKAFQDLLYIGELRQRWNEIKKLQHSPALAIA